MPVGRYQGARKVANDVEDQRLISDDYRSAKRILNDLYGKSMLLNPTEIESGLPDPYDEPDQFSREVLGEVIKGIREWYYTGKADNAEDLLRKIGLWVSNMLGYFGSQGIGGRKAREIFSEKGGENFHGFLKEDPEFEGQLIELLNWIARNDLYIVRRTNSALVEAVHRIIGLPVQEAREEEESPRPSTPTNPAPPRSNAIPRPTVREQFSAGGNDRAIPAPPIAYADMSRHPINSLRNLPSRIARSGPNTDSLIRSVTPESTPEPSYPLKELRFSPGSSGLRLRPSRTRFTRTEGLRDRAALRRFAVSYQQNSNPPTQEYVSRPRHYSRYLRFLSADGGSVSEPPQTETSVPGTKAITPEEASVVQEHHSHSIEARQEGGERAKASSKQTRLREAQRQHAEAIDRVSWIVLRNKEREADPVIGRRLEEQREGLYPRDALMDSNEEEELGTVVPADALTSSSRATPDILGEEGADVTFDSMIDRGNKDHNVNRTQEGPEAEEASAIDSDARESIAEGFGSMLADDDAMTAQRRNVQNGFIYDSMWGRHGAGAEFLMSEDSHGGNPQRLQRLGWLLGRSDRFGSSFPIQQSTLSRIDPNAWSNYVWNLVNEIPARASQVSPPAAHSLHLGRIMSNMSPQLLTPYAGLREILYSSDGDNRRLHSDDRVELRQRILDGGRESERFRDYANSVQDRASAVAEAANGFASLYNIGGQYGALTAADVLNTLHSGYRDAIGSWEDRARNIDEQGKDLFDLKPVYDSETNKRVTYDDWVRDTAVPPGVLRSIGQVLPHGRGKWDRKEMLPESLALDDAYWVDQVNVENGRQAPRASSYYPLGRKDDTKGNAELATRDFLGETVVADVPGTDTVLPLDYNPIGTLTDQLLDGRFSSMISRESRNFPPFEGSVPPDIPIEGETLARETTGRSLREAIGSTPLAPIGKKGNYVRPYYEWAIGAPMPTALRSRDEWQTRAARKMAKNERDVLSQDVMKINEAIRQLRRPESATLKFQNPTAAERHQLEEYLRNVSKATSQGIREKYQINPQFNPLNPGPLYDYYVRREQPRGKDDPLTSYPPADLGILPESQIVDYPRDARGGLIDGNVEIQESLTGNSSSPSTAMLSLTPPRAPAAEEEDEESYITLDLPEVSGNDDAATPPPVPVQEQPAVIHGNQVIPLATEDGRNGVTAGQIEELVNIRNELQRSLASIPEEPLANVNQYVRNQLLGSARGSPAQIARAQEWSRSSTPMAPSAQAAWVHANYGVTFPATTVQRLDRQYVRQINNLIDEQNPELRQRQRRLFRPPAGSVIQVADNQAEARAPLIDPGQGAAVINGELVFGEHGAPPLPPMTSTPRLTAYGLPALSPAPQPIVTPIRPRRGRHQPPPQQPAVQQPPPQQPPAQQQPAVQQPPPQEAPPQQPAAQPAANGNLVRSGPQLVETGDLAGRQPQAAVLRSDVLQMQHQPFWRPRLEDLLRGLGSVLQPLRRGYQLALSRRGQRIIGVQSNQKVSAEAQTAPEQAAIDGPTDEAVGTDAAQLIGAATGTNPPPDPPSDPEGGDPNRNPPDNSNPPRRPRRAMPTVLRRRGRRDGGLSVVINNYPDSAYRMDNRSTGFNIRRSIGGIPDSDIAPEEIRASRPMSFEERYHSAVHKLNSQEASLDGNKQILQSLENRLRFITQQRDQLKDSFGELEAGLKTVDLQSGGNMARERIQSLVSLWQKEPNLFNSQNPDSPVDQPMDDEHEAVRQAGNEEEEQGQQEEEEVKETSISKQQEKMNEELEQELQTAQPNLRLSPLLSQNYQQTIRVLDAEINSLQRDISQTRSFIKGLDRQAAADHAFLVSDLKKAAREAGLSEDAVDLTALEKMIPDFVAEAKEKIRPTEKDQRGAVQEDLTRLALKQFQLDLGSLKTSLIQQQAQNERLAERLREQQQKNQQAQLLYGQMGGGFLNTGAGFGYRFGRFDSLGRFRPTSMADAAARIYGMNQSALQSQYVQTLAAQRMQPGQMPSKQMGSIRKKLSRPLASRGKGRKRARKTVHTIPGAVKRKR